MSKSKIREIIGREYRCLDKGFVRLIDVMGDDAAIVQAARVSYGKGTKSVREDRGLIRYLMRHRHTSPFEMVEFKFHVKLPIFVARQWIRHRTANVNEYSGRYSEMRDEFYIPEAGDLRAQSEINRQGRSDDALDSANSENLLKSIKSHQRAAFGHYQDMIDSGLAREVARINLPLSVYTEWYWKIDLHNLLHFLKLRLDAHAQQEIRVYARAIAEMVEAACPIVWEAFKDFSLGGVSLSRPEQKAIAGVLAAHPIDEESLKKSGLSASEAREFFAKIKKIIEGNTL
ncbi:MAG: FAD-dependent thymidylate synthase [Candidatus Kapaibacterium sp.]